MTQKTNMTQQQIEQKITQAFSPTELVLENESHMHSGYFEGKESHFKLTVVSDAFQGKRLVQRHQMVYQLLADDLTSGGGQIHALAIHAFTPQERQKQTTPDSPNCHHKK